MAIQTVKVGESVNDGTGDPARTCFTKINQNFTDNDNAASRQVGTGAGNVMEVGAFGLGKSINEFYTTPSKNLNTGFYIITPSNQDDFPHPYGIFQKLEGVGWSFRFFFDVDGNVHLSKSINKATWDDFKQLLILNQNVTKDANGFIKAASPIIKLFADKIELNDEAAQQDITFEKIGVGDYLIKGSTGFAQEGWYVEMPKDANGNVLVAAAYEQLANGDISVKTYDYMLNKKGRIVPDLETPLDIPETRWIDLRLQALPQDDTQPLDTDETVATNAE